MTSTMVLGDPSLGIMALITSLPYTYWEEVECMGKWYPARPLHLLHSMNKSSDDMGASWIAGSLGDSGHAT